MTENVKAKPVGKENSSGNETNVQLISTNLSKSNSTPKNNLAE